MRSPFAQQRLPSNERSRLLRRILERATPRSGPSVVVFDLDGTLMDNRPRVVAILHELAEEWRSRHADAASRCARATADDIGYGFGDNLRRIGVMDAALHVEALEFWKARFFQDPHVRHDIGVAGARDYVRACYDAGAVIVYLTGRDLPNMALGSFASLRDLGFPIGVVGTELVTKPNFDIPDHEYKRSVAPGLSRIGTVVGFFDNEPSNCNLFVEAYPEATNVFVDTQHAPEPPPLDPRVHVIDSFEIDSQ